MTTAYALLLQRCGLSLQDAATLHGVQHDTAESWAAGHGEPSAAAMAALRDLYKHIEAAANQALQQIAKLAAANDEAACVELGLASDDHEAQSLGWPCAAAQAAMLGIVVAHAGLPVRVVPRGSTMATAASADQHDASLLPRHH